MNNINLYLLTVALIWAQLTRKALTQGRTDFLAAGVTYLPFPI